MQLTKNFNTLEDIKITGCKHWLTLPTQVQNNLKKITEVAQELRDYYECPIIVTSGYRDNKKNKELRMASMTSQHLFGEALDLVFKWQEEAFYDLQNKLQSDWPLSQVILEQDGDIKWLHIALSTNRFKKTAGATSHRQDSCEFLKYKDGTYELVKIVKHKKSYSA
jgi:hypothetical protein